MRLRVKLPFDLRHNRRAAFGVGKLMRGRILILLRDTTARRYLTGYFGSYADFR